MKKVCMPKLQLLITKSAIITALFYLAQALLTKNSLAISSLFLQINILVLSSCETRQLQS